MILRISPLIPEPFEGNFLDPQVIAPSLEMVSERAFDVSRGVSWTSYFTCGVGAKSSGVMGLPFCC